MTSRRSPRRLNSPPRAARCSCWPTRIPAPACRCWRRAGHSCTMFASRTSRTGANSATFYKGYPRERRLSPGSARTLMAILTRVHASNLVRWAKNKPEVIVLSADLTGSTEIDLFRRVYPERFFSMGMAEQNMLSWAGGMAREGFVPLVHTFAVFLYRRAYDQ